MSKNKQKTTIKYINNGTYGCVLRPAIPCDSVSKSDTNTVSKIFKTSESIKKEHKENVRISKLIDPESIFTVAELDSCIIDLLQIPEKEFIKCKNFSVQELKRKKHPQLIYEYGGNDLNVASTISSFKDIFIGMETIFIGLKSLESHKYAHMDIKPANIVYNSENKKVSLIDFGLLTDFSKVYTRSKTNILEYKYPYYPPEFAACYNFFQNTDKKKANYVNINNNFIELYDSYIKLITIYNAHQLIQTTFDKVFDSSKINSDFNQLDDMSNSKDFDKFCRRYANRIDVYSLGASLAKLMGICCYYGTLTNEDASSLPLFYSSVIKLIGDMLIIDPKKRLTPTQAYKRYTKVLSIINKECPPGKVINPKTGRCITKK